MQPVTLRAIRLHHYVAALKSREDAEWHKKQAANANSSMDRRNTQRFQQMAESRAEWHMQAVRALDPLITGTVEEDERRKFEGMEMLP